MSYTFSDVLKRQKVLQDYLKRTQGADPTDKEALLAAAAEMGEVLQAIKAHWAWWKRNDKKWTTINRDEVLEELADVLHFLAIFVLKDRGVDFKYSSRFEEAVFMIAERRSLVENILSFLQSYTVTAIYRFMVVVTQLGFTKEELYEAYMKKTEVNLKRWGIKEAPDVQSGI